MRNVKWAAFALAALASVTACQKENENTGSTSLQKLRAKWNVQKIDFDWPGNVPDSVYTGVTADYLDFRSDNKLYWQIDGSKDTSAYQLLNDETLVLDSDTASLTQLTGSQLVMKVSFPAPGDTSAIIYTLTR